MPRYHTVPTTNTHSSRARTDQGGTGRRRAGRRRAAGQLWHSSAPGEAGRYHKKLRWVETLTYRNKTENEQYQWNQVDMIFFDLQFTNIVGRCWWSLSVGSPITFLTTYFFMISVLCFNFVRWREAWQVTCPPFHIPLLCCSKQVRAARPLCIDERYDHPVSGIGSNCPSLPWQGHRLGTGRRRHSPTHTVKYGAAPTHNRPRHK